MNVRDVVQRWSRGIAAHGGNVASIRDGKVTTLYSYHEPIARLYDDTPDGVPVYAVTLNKWSVTTSKHTSMALAQVPSKLLRRAKFTLPSTFAEFAVAEDAALERGTP